MTQHPREEEMALYLTGDSANASAPLEAHLDQCEECRQIARELEESRSLLAGAPDDLKPEDLTEVRQRVLSRLSQPKPGARAWKWGLAVAAAAASIALIFVAGPHHTPPAVPSHAPSRVATKPPAVIAENPNPHVPAPATAAPVRTAQKIQHQIQRRPAPGLRSVALITRPNELPVIKITTSDPNVVILLPSDERTEFNE